MNKASIKKLFQKDGGVLSLWPALYIGKAIDAVMPRLRVISDGSGRQEAGAAKPECLLTTEMVLVECSASDQGN